MQGDRRIVTALFADLVDYVRMLAEQDAEEVKWRVDAALAAMDGEVVRFGGSREKFIGDAIFAVFGYPQSHDDDALRAGLCALSIRAALADLGAGGAEPLAVRIGIATGEVVAAARDVPGVPEISFTGPAVVIAARIQALAGPGEILIDDNSLRASRGRLVADDRGTRTLRGHPGPVRLHALRADLGLQHGRPPIGRLVGRLAERARLRGLIDRCRVTGVGQIGLVVGEAGIGKSRLLADLETDARAAGFHWTSVENVSYGAHEPYRFVRAFAQAIADEEGTDSGTLTRQLLFDDDIDPSVARRLGGAIAAVAREADFSGWEAEAPLAPTDPAEVTTSILEASRRYTKRLAETRGPRVVVIDDLHWADHSSLPMIEQLAGQAATTGFVVLIGTRRGPVDSWLEADGVERIDLGGLDPAEVGEMAADVAGTALVPDDARIVHERTAGNPLFVGETVRALLEDGMLELRDGQLALVGDPSTGRLPVTLRALLGARIDALPPLPRLALGAASVIGMDFAKPAVEELIGRPLRPSVFQRLVDSALVEVVDAGRSWRFAHALVRDAAYAGLLTSRRRSLHARLADQFEADPRAAIGRAALHRVAAGDGERAIPLLDQAAIAAMAVGAVAEAAAFWRRAAELVPVGDARAEHYRQAAVDAGEPDGTVEEAS